MSLQKLKTDPFRLSAQVNAVWNPSYPRTGEEGRIIAKFFPADHDGKFPDSRKECGWKLLVGELVDQIEAAWVNEVAKIAPDCSLEIRFNQDPNYVHHHAILTQELRPLTLFLNRGEESAPLDLSEKVYATLVTHLASPQLERMKLRLMLSRGERHLVRGFLKDFNARKTDQDRETDFDGCREVQLEELDVEIWHCEKMRSILSAVARERLRSDLGERRVKTAEQAPDCGEDEIPKED